MLCHPMRIVSLVAEHNVRQLTAACVDQWCCLQSVCHEPQCNERWEPIGHVTHLERFGIALLSSRVIGEAANTAAAGLVPDCRPSGVATSRASACGGGMRRPDSCAAAEAASAKPAVEADPRSSFRRARCAAASTAAGSTCPGGSDAVSIYFLIAMRAGDCNALSVWARLQEDTRLCREPTSLTS